MYLDLWLDGGGIWLVDWQLKSRKLNDPGLWIFHWLSVISSPSDWLQQHLAELTVAVRLMQPVQIKYWEKKHRRNCKHSFRNCDEVEFRVANLTTIVLDWHLIQKTAGLSNRVYIQVRVLRKKHNIHNWQGSSPLPQAQQKHEKILNRIGEYRFPEQRSFSNICFTKALGTLIFN